MKLKNLYIYSDKEKDAVYFVSNLLIKDVMKLMTHFRSACCINYKPPGRNASSSFGHDPQSEFKRPALNNGLKASKELMLFL